MDLFGIKLVGVNYGTAHKLAVSLALIVLLLIVRWLLAAFSRYIREKYPEARFLFWVRQVVSLVLVIVLIVGLVSIWLGNTKQLTTAVGLVGAGIAFALQKPISALAGYLVILRGRTFQIGNRISMGGVRGDVMALGFIQTTIMEMGEPPAEQSADPAMWVKARQFTGRIVTISNSKVFDEPVYNYTRDFPYVWEEMMIPVGYQADRQRAEAILLDAARHHTQRFHELSAESMHKLRKDYFVRPGDFEPRVFYRLTDNWLELAVRFVVSDRGVREVKDAMSREILAGLEAAGIDIASATYDIVGMPPIQLKSPPLTQNEGR